jgi:hypothetical protein
MPTENAETVNRTPEAGALTSPVAPKKAPAKKTAKPKNGAPKGHKSAKSAKPRATAGAKPKKAATAKAPKPQGPREGSKTAQVVAMLQRKNGATLPEIMDKVGWQKHTVRGFMAGAMKKAGYAVESFKTDKGDRTYRINQ